jgi:hypothetical protein
MVRSVYYFLLGAVLLGALAFGAEGALGPNFRALRWAGVPGSLDGVLHWGALIAALSLPLLHLEVGPR